MHAKRQNAKAAKARTVSTKMLLTGNAMSEMESEKRTKIDGKVAAF